MAFCFAGPRKPPSRGVLPAAWVLIFSGTLGTAQAQDLCGDIDTLIEQSRSGFSEIATKGKGAAGEHGVTLALAGASSCSVTRKSKRTWYHCAWEFPHRAEQAYDTFDRFVERLNDCVGRRATVHSDRSVNHPDHYASRRYELNQAEVSVSIKDKSALGRSFVFIRVQSSDGS